MFFILPKIREIDVAVFWKFSNFCQRMLLVLYGLFSDKLPIARSGLNWCQHRNWILVLNHFRCWHQNVQYQFNNYSTQIPFGVESVLTPGILNTNSTTIQPRAYFVLNRCWHRGVSNQGWIGVNTFYTYYLICIFAPDF